MKKLLLILLSALSLTALAQNDVKRVAILETVDKMGTVPYLKQLMFRSNLTTAITNTTGYEGYDRTDLKEILGEHNFQRTGMVSDKDIKKIGEFTGAQYVLIAEATIDGSDMFITAKIIDVETARVIRNSNQLMGTSASEMQEGSQKVAADLLGVSSSRTTSSTSHKSKDVESLNIHWMINSRPQGTDILWRIISQTPEVQNTKFKYMEATPFDVSETMNIKGLTYDNAKDVQIELRAERNGYYPQTKKIDVQSLISDPEYQLFFKMILKDK